MPLVDPDKRREYQRQNVAKWRANNPERNKEINRNSAQKRRDLGLVDDRTAAERQRRWRENNVDRAREVGRKNSALYRQRHPHVVRARLSGVDAAATLYLLNDPCSYCGGSAGEIDHIIPAINGGSGDEINLTAACRSCNASKNDRSLLTYLVDRAKV